MNREQVQHFLNEGYDIIQDGTPVVVKGDLWDYVDTLGENHPGVYILDEIIKWSDEDLAKI